MKYEDIQFWEPIINLWRLRERKREGGGETETARETERQTDRQTDRQAGRQADRQTDRDLGRSSQCEWKRVTVLYFWGIKYTATPVGRLTCQKPKELLHSYIPFWKVVCDRNVSTPNTSAFLPAHRYRDCPNYDRNVSTYQRFSDFLLFLGLSKLCSPSGWIKSHFPSVPLKKQNKTPPPPTPPSPLLHPYFNHLTDIYHAAMKSKIPACCATVFKWSKSFLKIK